MLDPGLFTKAAYFIGATLILSVVGIITIVLVTDDTIPDILQNIAVGALTGLVGLLVQRAPSK